MVTDDIYHLISNHQLVDAVKLLGEQLQENEYVTVELRDRYHSAKWMLETMLQYLESPIQDPDLAASYNYLLRTLYEVTDALRDKEWLAQIPQYEKLSKYYTLLLDDGGLTEIAEQLAHHSDLRTTDRPRYDDLVTRLSMGLLYTHEWSDELAVLLDKMDDYVQQTILTAVTLALLRTWHWDKLCWLLSKLIATQGSRTAVRVRAVVGVILVGEINNSRLELYKAQFPYTLQQIGKAISLEEYDMTWSHRLRMKYTPQVVEYVHKLFGRFNTPDFQQRFQEIIASTGDDATSISLDNAMDDEELLPLVEDVQDGYKALKRLVSRGFDVNAFATNSLLQGPFFDDEAHWLIPFDLYHSSLGAVMAQFREQYQLGEDQIMNLLGESLFQPVDIDCYGTLFRISQLPSQVLQGISHGVIAMENVINRTPYTPPQETGDLDFESYIKALQGYICQLSRFFNRKGDKVAAETPFEIHIVESNPFVQKQKEELYDKHLELLRAYCEQTKESVAEQKVIQLQIMSTTDPIARAQLKYRLAQAYYEEQKYMQAYLIMLQVPLETLPGDAGHLFIAQILYRMKQLDLAITLLEKVRLESDAPLLIIRRLGAFYIHIRLYDKALPLLLKCEFEDEHPDTLYPMIAWCLMMEQRWDEAKVYASRPVTSYDQIDKDSPEHSYKYLALLLPALLTLISGDLQGALKTLGRLFVSVDKEYHNMVLSTYGECMQDLKQIGVPSHLLELIQSWLQRRVSTL